jgi:hypothetical protein
MPMHKGCESPLVTAADVVRQQLSIGQTCTLPQKQRPAKVLDDPAYLAWHHVLALSVRPLPSVLLLPEDGGLIHDSGWGGAYLNNDTPLWLQVDDTPEPIKELRRLVEKSAKWRKRVPSLH